MIMNSRCGLEVTFPFVVTCDTLGSKREVGRMFLLFTQLLEILRVSTIYKSFFSVLECATHQYLRLML
jgi:hypothetical protein